MTKQKLFDLKKVDYVMVKGEKVTIDDAVILECKGEKNKVNFIISKEGIHHTKCANQDFVNQAMATLHQSNIFTEMYESLFKSKDELLSYLATK